MQLLKPVTVRSLPLLLFGRLFLCCISCANAELSTWKMKYFKYSTFLSAVAWCCYTPTFLLQDAAASVGCKQAKGSLAKEPCPQTTEQRDRQTLSGRANGGTCLSASCALTQRFAPCCVQPQHCTALCVIPQASPMLLWSTANWSIAWLFTERASNSGASLYLVKQLSSQAV